MKRNILKFAVIALGVLPMVSCSDDDNSDEIIIESQELPENAQSFISTYFPASEYSRVAKNAVAEIDGTLYEVSLKNNFEIDFTAEGIWVDIDGSNQEIPEGIVPENLSTYIAENYPELFITGIDTETNGYEVNLSNDLDVHFDSEGNFLKEEK